MSEEKAVMLIRDDDSTQGSDVAALIKEARQHGVEIKYVHPDEFDEYIRLIEGEHPFGAGNDPVSGENDH
jgi:hypothetical protein